jgi:chromosomal replication initiator protein
VAAETYERQQAEGAIRGDAFEAALAVYRKLNEENAKAVRAAGIPPEVEAVIAAVAKRHGFTLAEFRAHGRSSNQLAQARGEAIYVVRVISDVSLPMLGRYFGGRHHSTILAARDAFAERMKNNDVLLARVDRVIGAAKADGAEKVAVAS